MSHEHTCPNCGYVHHEATEQEKAADGVRKWAKDEGYHLVKDALPAHLVAQYLRCSTGNLYNKRNKGELVGQKIAGRLHFTAAEIAEFLIVSNQT